MGLSCGACIDLCCCTFDCDIFLRTSNDCAQIFWSGRRSCSLCDCFSDSQQTLFKVKQQLLPLSRTTEIPRLLRRICPTSSAEENWSEPSAHSPRFSISHRSSDESCHEGRPQTDSENRDAERHAEEVTRTWDTLLNKQAEPCHDSKIARLFGNSRAVFLFGGEDIQSLQISLPRVTNGCKSAEKSV